jgi:hypothetical protein
MAVGLFGKLETNTHASPKECVLVFLHADPLPDEFWTLQDKLYEVMDNSNVGEFDGNEIGKGTATLFFYGPDANQLFRGVEPILKGYPMCRNARVVLRKGGPGSRQTEFQL